MPLPLDQWQFYVVSAVALAGLWLLVRPFLRRSGGGCPGCGSAKPSSARRRSATPLTIDGRRRERSH